MLVSIYTRQSSSIFQAMLAIFVCLISTGFAPSVKAASFDCSKGDLQADEKAICAKLVLNDLDVKMATRFELISGLLPMGNRGDLQNQQVDWLKTRSACQADTTCLENAYQARLAKLKSVYESLQKTSQ